MNIYEKLAAARAEFKTAGIKQSGNNTFAGYKYFDLSDILPATTRIEKDLGMLSVVRYESDRATLTIYNAEKPEEFIEFSSPMSTAELKGCHAVQNLGAVETYVRRYLYLAAYEIVETETLDKTQGDPDKATSARKPANGNAQGQSEMTVQQAEEFTIKSGKYEGKKLKEIPYDTVRWLALNSKGALQQAAEILVDDVENPKKRQMNIYDDDGDIPF